MWLYADSYTYVRHQLGFMDHTPALVLHHLDVISSSVYAESVTDMVMKTNLEENAILFEAFKQLGPAMQAAPPQASEVYDVVERSLAKLDAWQEKYLHTMVTVSQWGDSPDRESCLSAGMWSRMTDLKLFRVQSNRSFRCTTVACGSSCTLTRVFSPRTSTWRCLALASSPGNRLNRPSSCCAGLSRAVSGCR